MDQKISVSNHFIDSIDAEEENAVIVVEGIEGRLSGAQCGVEPVGQRNTQISNQFTREHASGFEAGAYTSGGLGCCCLICGRVNDLFNLYDIDVSDTDGLVSIVNLVLQLNDVGLVRSSKACSECAHDLKEVFELHAVLKRKEDELLIRYNETCEYRQCDKSILTDEYREINVTSDDILDPVKEELNLKKSCEKCLYVFHNTHDRHYHQCIYESNQTDYITSNALSDLKKEIDECKKIKSINKSNRYKCLKCDITLLDKKEYVAHMEAHDRKGTFDCHVCGRFLTSKARLETHMFKFHGIGKEKKKIFKCTDCSKCFSTKPGLMYHRKVSHQTDTQYVCKFCHKVYFHYDPYKSHLLFAHGERKITCETCGEKFFTVSKLNVHINAVHRNAQSWQCVPCGAKFTTCASFRQHNLVTHHNTKQACQLCSQQFRLDGLGWDHHKIS